MANKTVRIHIGRDAKTGRFIPVEKAVKDPPTTVVETIKPCKPGTPVKKPKNL